MSKVVVLGSINADLVLRTSRLPSSGETIQASAAATFPGGKGANQAVAAARMGAHVELIGRVGDDASGRQIVDALERTGVGMANITIDAEQMTGTALITVADDGANTIVTTGGANHAVGGAELDRLRRLIAEATVLCVQLEIPMAVVETAVTIASDAGVPVICDPAPVAALSDALCRRLAWITPNEHEAEGLTGSSDPVRAADALRHRGVDHVAVTLGPRGVRYAGRDGALDVPTPRVSAVDTVACGDAFAGALAASIAGGLDVARALRTACAAGALASTVPGAFPSLPGREAVDALLATG